MKKILVAVGALLAWGATCFAFMLPGMGIAHASEDEVERLGMDRTLDALARADLALVVLDLSQPLDEADREALALARGQPHLVLLNKLDLVTACRIGSLMGSLKVAVQGPQNHKHSVEEIEERFKNAFGYSYSG